MISRFISKVENISSVHDRIESARAMDIKTITGEMDALKNAFAAYEKDARERFAASEALSEEQMAKSIDVIQKEIDVLRKYLDSYCIKRLKHHIPSTRAYKPNMNNLEKIHRDFILDPFWLKGVNVVTLGTYKKNLANDFASDCESGINWYNNQIAEIRKNRAAERKNREEKLNADIHAKKAKLDSDLAPLNIKLKKQNDTHDASLHTLIFDSREIMELYSDLSTTANKWGLLKNTWEEYTLPIEKPNTICLGYARIPVNYSEITKRYLSESKMGPFFSKETGILAPFCVPLNSNIAIEYPNEMRDEIVSGIQGVITRFIRSMPSKGFEVNFIDPIGRGSSIGRLIKLSKTEPHNCPLLNEPAATKTEIAEQLKKIVEYIGDTSKVLAQTGEKTTIEDYNGSHPDKLKYHIVVIEDFTEGLDTSFLDYLKTISSETAKKCGVVTILATNRKYAPKERFADFYTEYKKNSVFVYESNNVLLCDYDNTKLRAKIVDASKVTDLYISQVYGEYVKKLELDNSAERFYDTTKDFKFGDATKALKIPFAVNGRNNEIVEMELGGSTTSFAMITGTQGSGKSTTLHAIIVGLMANYHPNDVELWLVDYKMTEFATMYRGKRLPHVKYLGLENSPEFTYGILDKIKEEFERRGSVLKQLGFQDIKTYMKARNKQIAEGSSDVLPPMPRIVLVMDEVSNLASHINERSEYKEFFEHMIRTYRAWGLCAVFADQYPIANNHGITDDAQDLIMTRMAMSHNLQHMKSTLLLTSNDYSDELLNDMSNMSSGDIIYKYKIEYSDWTTETIIEKYKSVYLKEHEIDNILKKINSQLPDGSFDEKDTKTIESSERVPRNNTLIKEFAKANPLSDEENTGIYLGTPTTFEECFRFELSTRRSNNILVITSNRDMHFSVIINSIRSFQSYKGNKTIVIAHPKSKIYKLNKQEIDHISEVNNDVVIINKLEDACACLEHYSELVKNREEAEKVLIVFLGIEEWYEDFAIEEDSEINVSTWTTKTKNVVKSISGKKLSSKDIDSQLSELYEMYPDEDEDDDFVDNTDFEVKTTEVKRISLNAKGYVESILQAGSRYNVYSLMSFETPAELMQTKIKVEHFGHKIVGSIQKSDAYNISFPAPALGAFSNKSIADANLLYSNGIGEPLRFRPYSNKK